jgi:hypothetical protein
LATQIASYLTANRRRKYGAVGTVTLDSLRDFCEQRSGAPICIDEGYIMGSTFNISQSDEGEFVIVFSTIRLSRLEIGDIVHSDCTYKCTWNNYPVTMMGFSDKDRVFHPIIIAVSSRETHTEFEFMLRTWKAVNASLNFRYLMADASEAVFNAARTIWPDIVRLMCYAHVYMVRTFVLQFTFSCMTDVLLKIFEIYCFHFI